MLIMMRCVCLVVVADVMCCCCCSKKGRFVDFIFLLSLLQLLHEFCIVQKRMKILLTLLVTFTALIAATVLETTPIGAWEATKSFGKDRVRIHTFFGFQGSCASKSYQLILKELVDEGKEDLIVVNSNEPADVSTFGKGGLAVGYVHTNQILLMESIFLANVVSFLESALSVQTTASLVFVLKGSSDNSKKGTEKIERLVEEAWAIYLTQKGEEVTTKYRDNNEVCNFSISSFASCTSMFAITHFILWCLLSS